MRKYQLLPPEFKNLNFKDICKRAWNKFSLQSFVLNLKVELVIFKSAFFSSNDVRTFSITILYFYGHAHVENILWNTWSNLFSWKREKCYKLQPKAVLAARSMEGKIFPYRETANIAITIYDINSWTAFLLFCTRMQHHVGTIYLRPYIS